MDKEHVNDDPHPADDEDKRPNGLDILQMAETMEMFCTDPVSQNIVVYCVDVGSIMRHNFGWARGAVVDTRLDLTSSEDVGDFIVSIVDDLNGGSPVALGFECPLFIPYRDDPLTITKARSFDGNRAWSAAAGANSLVTGLAESAWILKTVKGRLNVDVPPFLSLSDFVEARKGLLLWEAFVSSTMTTGSHSGDAIVGVLGFYRVLARREDFPETDGQPVYSLIGAALLRTGWTDDISVLEKPCLVVRGQVTI
ncbi:MAG: hypothetical protein GY771_16110 [bacterium]|nr:hypothetical protein [bacterium]